MVPLMLMILLTVALLDRLILDYIPQVGDAGRAGIHLVSNIIIGLAGIEVLRRSARRQRQRHNTTSTVLAVAENEGAPIFVAAEVEPAYGHDDHGHDAHAPVPAH